MKPIPSNKELLEITRIVLKQNQFILEMNARLLRQFEAPLIKLDPHFEASKKFKPILGKGFD